MRTFNKALCPQCLGSGRRAKEIDRRATVEAYGKVPPDEYTRLKTKSEAVFDEEAYRTFNEDWDIYGASNGTIHITYCGKCSICGLGTEMRHDKDFFPASRDAT